MADIITTLHPENNSDDNLYPNIKPENIENGSLSGDKFIDNSIYDVKLKSGIILSGDNTSEVKEFYSIVNNPTSVNYTNEKISIYASLDNLILKNSKCIKIFDELGNEKTFEIRRSLDENIVIDKDYTNFQNSYYKNFEIIFFDSIESHSNKTYIIKVYPVEQDNNFNINITSEINPNNGNIIIKNSNIELLFQNTGHYRLIQYKTNRTYFPDFHFGLIENSVNIKEYDSAFNTFLIDYEYEIIGKGINYLTLKRILHCNDFDFIQYTTLYNNDNVTIKSYIRFKNDVSNVSRFYFRESCPLNVSGNSISLNNVNLFYYSDGSVNISQCCSYITANSQRDRANYPTYTPLLSESISTTLSMWLGWELGSSTNVWYKDYILSSELVINYNINSSNELLKIFNNLTSSMTDINKYELKIILKDLINKECVGIKDIFKTSNSETPKRFLNPYLSYIDYINNTINENDLKNDYLYMINNVYGGYTSEQLRTVYNNYGLAYLGRSIIFTYYMYKMFGDELYSDILINYANMLVNLYNEKHDIPLTNNLTSGNGNSRAMAMYGLAIAIKLTNDLDYINTFNSINNLMNLDIVMETIIPEGVINKNRYLHYTTFANFYYSLALQLYKPSNYMYNTYSYIFEASLSNGELKDLTYCSSDSRRGLPHTYSYAIGVLGISDNVSAIKQAINILKWLKKQNPIVGNYPSMLDGYNTYPISENATVFNLGFAISGLIDLYNMVGD